MSTEPDMDKVRRALARYADKPRKGKAPVIHPPAHDAAIRKPLKSHGTPCKGFSHPNFLNRD